MNCVICQDNDCTTPANPALSVPVCSDCSHDHELHVDCECCGKPIPSDEAIYCARSGEYFHENINCFDRALHEDDEIGRVIFHDAWKEFFATYGNPINTTATDLTSALNALTGGTA